MGVPPSGPASAGDVQSTQRRLRRLLDANRSIVGEVSLSAVLGRIVEAARDLAGARYAALGVAGSDGGIDDFICVGMTADVAEAIGHNPQGEGVLGALLVDRTVIRMPEIDRHEQFRGFPAGHPPIRSFLGVPIEVADAVLGALYLADRVGGEFTAEDEDLMLGLAAMAGFAIQNAKLYEECHRRLDWLKARAAVSRHIVADDPIRAVGTITTSLLQLADADAVWVVRGREDGAMEVLAAEGSGAERIRGARYQRAGSVADAAIRKGSGLLITDPDGYHETRIDPGRSRGPDALMVLPLRTEHGMAGALLVARHRFGRPFTPVDLELADGFAAATAVALEVADVRSTEHRLAVFEDRDRVARDLHDHVIQRLFAVGLRLQSLTEAVPDPAAQLRLGDVIGDVDETIRSLRTAISTLRHPPGAGLRETVLSVVDAMTPTLPGRPEVVLAGELDRLTDAALILDVEAVVLEGLSNIGRHARARWATVRIELKASELEVLIRDDGCGIPPGRRRSGLDNLRRRARQHGGRLMVTCPKHGGTNLSWTIPVTL